MQSQSKSTFQQSASLSQGIRNEDGVECKTVELTQHLRHVNAILKWIKWQFFCSIHVRYNHFRYMQSRSKCQAQSDLLFQYLKYFISNIVPGDGFFFFS